MKKVLGAALIGSLALGALTADPKFTVNYRTRAQVFDQKSAKQDGDTITKRSWLDQDGYAEAQDSLGIKVDNDNYGAQFQLNADAATKNLLKKGDKANDKEKASGIGVLNTYNGWMKFEDAGITLRAGSWKDGYADGNYRVKKLIDAASLEGIDGEAVKLGGVFKGTNITFIDNMAYFKGDGEGNLAFFAEYGLDLDDAMSLNFLLGAVTSTFNDTSKEPADEVTEVCSGPVFRAQLKMKELLNAQVIWKNASVKNHAVGVYVMPDLNGLAGIPLTLNVGGAMGFTAENQNADMKMESWEVDLRAIYQVDDSLSIHTMNGLASYVFEGDKGYNAGCKLGRNFVNSANYPNTFDKTVFPDKMGYSDQAYLKMALWDMIGARYVVNDSLTVGGNVNFLIPLAVAQDNNGKDVAEKVGMQVRVTPYVQIYAAKNAFVNIGFSWATGSLDLGGGKMTFTDISVPVVFRVKC